MGWDHVYVVVAVRQHTTSFGKVRGLKRSSRTRRLKSVCGPTEEPPPPPDPAGCVNWLSFVPSKLYVWSVQLVV